MRSLIAIVFFVPYLAWSQGSVPPASCAVKYGYQINTDTVQIKSKIAPAVGMTLTVIDTCGNAVWARPATVYTDTVDSIATTGATVSPSYNDMISVYASGSITCTVAFPAPVLNAHVAVVFNRAATITPSGTGTGPVSTFTSGAIGTTYYFHTDSGLNWRYGP
jgi:hypothetical protein